MPERPEMPELLDSRIGVRVGTARQISDPGCQDGQMAGWARPPDRPDRRKVPVSGMGHTLGCARMSDAPYSKKATATGPRNLQEASNVWGNVIVTARKTLKQSQL